MPGTSDLDRLAISVAAFRRPMDLASAIEKAAGDAFWVGRDFFQRACG